MANVRNVFIFNETGTGPNSTADLNALFTTSKKIFDTRPDVLMNNFNFNMDGLSNPIFVVPGGKTPMMGISLYPVMTNIKKQFGENFCYVGVCAGAYLGAADATLFSTRHTFNNYNKLFDPEMFLMSTKKENINLNIIDDYEAYGAFHPDNSRLYCEHKDLTPYSVTLSFTNHHTQLPQLYVAGPVLIPNKTLSTSSSEVIATYNNIEKQSDALAAIILKRPQENKGGKLLAATHIETCVENSKLLTFFKTTGVKNAALSQEAYEKLQNESNNIKTQIELILHETLRKA